MQSAPRHRSAPPPGVRRPHRRWRHRPRRTACSRPRPRRSTVTSASAVWRPGQPPKGLELDALAGQAPRRSTRPSRRRPAPPASATRAPARAATTAMFDATPPRCAHERVRVGQPLHRPLADEVDERIAEAHHRAAGRDGAHPPDVILAAGCASTSTRSNSPAPPCTYGGPPRPDPPPLFLHGLPTSSDDWTPLLERAGGLAVDLPGFGRTGKGGHLDLTPAGQAAFLGRLLDHLEIPRVRILAHDWGAAGALHLAPRATAGRRSARARQPARRRRATGGGSCARSASAASAS